MALKQVYGFVYAVHEYDTVYVQSYGCYEMVDCIVTSKFMYKHYVINLLDNYESTQDVSTRTLSTTSWCIFMYPNYLQVLWPPQTNPNPTIPSLKLKTENVTPYNQYNLNINNKSGVIVKITNNDS